MQTAGGGKSPDLSFPVFQVHTLKLSVCVMRCVKKSCTRVQLLCLVWLFATLWTVTRQAPLSLGFPRKEYWIGLPFPPPKDLPDPGTEPVSPASPALADRFFTDAPPGKPYPQEWTRVNPKINGGLWGIMTYQYRFISCNKCISLVQGVDNAGGCTWQGCGGWGVWELCEPKTTLKII